MQGKNIFLSIGLGLLLLIGIGWFYLRKEPSVTTPTQITYSEVTIPTVQNMQIFRATLLPNTSTIRYLKKKYENGIEKSTFWDRENNNKEKQISNIEITGVHEAIWSPTGSQVLLLIDNRQKLANSQPMFHKKDLPDFSTNYYLFDPKNNQAQKLPENIFLPTWSPDDKKIVYAWKNETLTISNPDGSNFQPIWDLSKDKLIKNSEFGFLSWNSQNTIVTQIIDGHLIPEAVSAHFALGKIYSINPITKEYRLLTKNANSPISSSNNKYVVMARWGDSEQGSLVLWDENLHKEKVVTFNFDPTRNIFFNFIEWNSDGKTLYTLELIPTPRIFKVNSDTGNYETFPLEDPTLQINQILLNEKDNVLYLVGENNIKTFDLSANKETGIITQSEITTQLIQKDLIYEKYKTEIVIAQGIVQSSRLVPSKKIETRQTYNIVFKLNKNFKTHDEAQYALNEPNAVKAIAQFMNKLNGDLKQQNLQFNPIDSLLFLQKNGVDINMLPRGTSIYKNE